MPEGHLRRRTRAGSRYRACQRGGGALDDRSRLASRSRGPRGRSHRLGSRGQAGRALVRAHRGKTLSARTSPRGEPPATAGLESARDSPGHPRLDDRPPGALAGGSRVRRAVAALPDRPLGHDRRRQVPCGRAPRRRDGRQLPALVSGDLLTIGSIGGTALVARSVGGGRPDEAAPVLRSGLSRWALSLGIRRAGAGAGLRNPDRAGDEPYRAGRGVVDPLSPDRRRRDPAPGLHHRGQRLPRGRGRHPHRNEGDGPHEPGQYRPDLAAGRGLGADSRARAHRDRDRHGLRRGNRRQPHARAPDPGPLRPAPDASQSAPSAGPDRAALADQLAGGRREPDQRPLSALVPAADQSSGCRGDRRARGGDPLRGDRLPDDHGLLGRGEHAHRSVSGRPSPRPVDPLGRDGLDAGRRPSSRSWE